jgi:hypothetical protein
MESIAESSHERGLSRKRLAACAVALVCLTAFAHIDGLANGFLDWDDGDNVTGNPHIQSLDFSMLHWAFTSVDRHNWQPLSWLSFAIDYALYGEDPRGYHLGNLVLHFFNALWVFALGCTLLPIVRAYRSGIEAPSATPVLFASFLGAALFGVHPQHVESVAWISERKDVLFFFFYVPSLIAYLRFAVAADPVQRRRWYVASLACFFASILSQPLAVSLPVVLLLLDVYPLRRVTRVPLSRLALEKLPFIAGSLLSAAMTLRAQWEGMTPVETNTPLLRLLNASDAIAAYIRHWALPFDLSPQYAYRFSLPGAEASVAEYGFVLAFALATTVVVSVLWMRGVRAPLASWAFYGITLLPVLGIVSVGSAGYADRYAYLPTLPLHLGFGVFAAWVICAEDSSKLRRISALVLAIGILATMTNLTKEQTRFWKNDVTLWNHAVALTPQDFTTQLHAAHAHDLAENLPEAAHHFRLAFNIQHGGRGDPFLSTMRLIFAQILFTLREFEESAEVLTRIEGGAPLADVQDLHERLAIAFCRRKELGAARDQLGRFAALGPRLERVAAVERRLEAPGCSAN